MAVTRRARVVSTISGSPNPVWSRPEAASQSFKDGDLVYMVAGYLTICGADPATILGIAKEDAHNTTAGLYNILVDVITADSLVEMQVAHDTPANAVIEAADFGKLYDIAVTSNVWYVDKNTTAATRVRIQRFVDALGTTNGRVLTTILAANREVA